MVSYTAPTTLTDADLGTDSGYVGPYSTLTPTQVVNGFQPDGEAGAVAWTSTARTGFTAGDVGFDSGYVGPYSTLEATQVVNGIQPDADLGAAEWSGPTIERPGSFSPDEIGFDPEFHGQYSDLEPTHVVNDFQPDDGAVPATLIPTRYFRKVTGIVRNAEGEPITEAQHIFTVNNLPTVGSVDENGRFEIYLLRQVYENFYLVTEAEGNRPYRYARYELADSNRIVDISTERQDLYFDTTVQKPVKAGEGVAFGGMMQ
ncbi:head protein [Haloarcula californiae icosahedral virus 1]|uniref:VP6 n=1 Tax=Haloarcula californiae icosahedral virus 1 TaxID=1735722 RepID=A0A1C7A3R9_9VIRU|nr:head protein [Haloarcula californiae icosahedral virus 1]ALJ99692.1 VP6 [Haloarcula californiae icosahedral virus 1]